MSILEHLIFKNKQTKKLLQIRKLRFREIKHNLPVLGIYPDKTLIWKDKCTPMFTAALFTIAKTWKQPKCPLTDEWIKKMWYIHTMEYYSAIRKWNNAICSNMDGPRDYHSKWLCKRKTNTIWYHLYVESKIWHKWAYLWNRNRRDSQI